MDQPVRQASALACKGSMFHPKEERKNVVNTSVLWRVGFKITFMNQWIIINLNRLLWNLLHTQTVPQKLTNQFWVQLVQRQLHCSRANMDSTVFFNLDIKLAKAYRQSVERNHIIRVIYANIQNPLRNFVALTFV